MTDNVVPLDLARFPQSDLDKLGALQSRMRLVHRWFRMERHSDADLDAVVVYSGAQGPFPYVAYRITRSARGVYTLYREITGEELARARSIDGMIAALPNDFYHQG